MIVLVMGLPGSGKSYFASRLAERINAEYTNSDRLRKELFPKRTYFEQEKAKVYEMLLAKMEEAINQKKNLVLDATFHKKATRELFVKNAKGRIHFIEVWTDEATIIERLKKSRPYSEADYRVYQLIKQAWEPLNKGSLRLKSTNDNIDDMLRKANQYLNHDNSGNQ